MAAETNFGIVLLAAGGSSRLGRPKQKLLYNGQSLLQHAIKEASASRASSTVVVLGANAAILQEELDGASAEVAINYRWEEGMASSINCGVRTLMRLNPAMDGLIIMLCDQPFVGAALLNELILVYEKTDKPIITCGFAGTYGPPTFFQKNLFPDLLQLNGDVGARSLLWKYGDKVEAIDFPAGSVDVDTEADYLRLVKGG
jgi:molybdenum cofactor cytidylyltransferase